MEKNIIENSHKRNEVKKKKILFMLVVLFVIVISFFSFKIGRSFEEKEKFSIREEILIKKIYKDISELTYLLEHSYRWSELKDNITRNNDSYVQILIALEKLKATLRLGDEMFYYNGENLSLNTLADAMDRSFFVISGLTSSGERISNNFFEDGVINESEKMYLEQLSESYSDIHQNMHTSIEEENEMISIFEFDDLIQPFINKYNTPDAISEFKIEN